LKIIGRLSGGLVGALVLVTCSGLFASCGGCGRGASPVAVDAHHDAGMASAPDTSHQTGALPSIVPDGVELADGQAGPEFIAVDDRFVYWTNFEEDGVFKIGKDGAGPPIVIGRNDRGDNKSIAVDETAVYWGGTSLHKQVKSTSSIQQFNFTSILVARLTMSGGRLYWIDDGKSDVQLKSMKADGTDMRLIGAAEKQDFTFAIDGASAFIGRFRLDKDDEGEIDVAPLAGGTPSVFAKTKFVRTILTDDRFVYWLEGRSLGVIKKKSKTGIGAPIVLTAGLQVFGPQSLAADTTSLYWTELGVDAAHGAVGRVSKAGGDARLIAKNQIIPQGIAVDDTCIYWVNYGPTKSGTIRKISK
jgi:hypothetical protein